MSTPKEFWENNMSNSDTLISPFRIKIPQSDLDDLQARLTNIR
jgi:hypothetical protein